MKQHARTNIKQIESIEYGISIKLILTGVYTTWIMLWQIQTNGIKGIPIHVIARHSATIIHIVLQIGDSIHDIRPQIAETGIYIIIMADITTKSISRDNIDITIPKRKNIKHVTGIRIKHKKTMQVDSTKQPQIKPKFIQLVQSDNNVVPIDRIRRGKRHARNIKYELHRIVIKQSSAGATQQISIRQDIGGGRQHSTIMGAVHAHIQHPMHIVVIIGMFVYK